jgi:hypothetical protein
MTLYLIGPEADLIAIERTIWNGNIRAVANGYWGGEVKNVKTCVKHQIDDLSDDDLDDREAYPLFGYRGHELNSVFGFTTAWGAPQEGADGRYALESNEHPRIRDLLSILLDAFPEVTEEDISYDEFFGVEDEV